MQAVRIICPGCGAALSSAEALEAGKLVDCPRCRLLFAPTTDDLANPRGRGDEIAIERAWADADDVPRPYPRSSPFDARRRYRWLTENEWVSVLVACLVMTVLAGVVVGTYLLYIAGPRPNAPAPAAPAPAAPVAAEPAPAPPPPPVGATEVEDDRSAPRKPVPVVDDDDPPVRP